MTRLTTTLIIRCFNEEAHLGRLLTGVTRQTFPPDEIIVVDSGSTDSSVEIAAGFGASVIEIDPSAFSFGRALNVGLAHATADIAVIASAHVFPVYDTWLSNLVEPLTDLAVALSYGRQQTPPGGRFSEQRLLEQWFPMTSAPRQSHPFCNNANAAIRRSVWLQQPYDEQLTGLEDLDWAKRAMAVGHQIAYVAEAPVIHVHDESFSQVVNRYRREALAHKAIYNDQKLSPLDAARLAVANVGQDALEARRLGVLRKHALDIPRFRFAQFIGTYQGFAQSGPVTAALKRRFYYPSPPSSQCCEVDEASVGTAIDYTEAAA